MAPPQAAAAAAAAVAKASIVPRSLTAPDAWISLLLLLYLQYQQLCRARQRKAFQRGRIIQTKKTKNREGATAAAAESRPASAASAASRARLSSSLIHEWLFTNLTVMTSPFSQMASNLNAQMVDLQSDQELHNYAQMVAASSPSEDGGSAAAVAAAAAGGSRGGRGKKGRASKSTSGKEPLVKGTIEIRTRRIKSSEMVFQWSPIPIYPILETVLNISLSLALGLLSRWLWGVVRSLRLSSLRGSVVGGGVGGGGSSGGGVVVGGGPCCSPYRGGDDPGSRMVGSFERLLACVLIKGEGDEAGNFILSALGVVLLFVGVVGLAWNVSLPPSLHDNDDDEDNEDGDGDNSNNNEDDDDKSSKGAFDPKKVKRFFIGVISTIASLWLFHTPPLLRTLGLGGLHNAAEEWSVRLILFLQLVGIIASSSSSSSSLSSYSSVVVVVDETSGVPVLGIPPSVQFLMNTFFILLALAWGYIASAMMIPIQETARNAAYVLSPSTSSSSSLSPGSSTTNTTTNNNNKRRGQKSSSTASKRSDMFELINVRMMLVIQALAPFMIMCTYLFADRLANPMNNKSRSPLSDDGNGGGSTRQHSFSKQYMQHSGLFIRVSLSWCFLAASMYTFRPLLQSFLDQATSVASAMATFGEKKSGPRGRSGGGGNSKSSSKNASKSLSDDTPKIDPFSERYGRLVLTAGRIASFPSFVFAMLAMAHLRAGDGSAHPGIGHQSQPHDAPRTTVLPVKGLIPPYSGSYMLWMDNNKKGSGISKDGNVGSSGDALLQAASMSHMSWEPTPFRDATHRKIADWTGSGKMFCNPPEVRSVKALRRHVTFLLENNSNGGVDGMKQSDDGRGSVLTINAMTGRELLDMAPPLPVTLLDYMMGRQLTKTSSDDSNSRSCNDLDGGYCNSNEEDTMQSPSLWEILDSLLSHNIMTPTVIYPIIDTFAFLSSVWWMYRYTTMMTIYWIQLRTTSSLSETWYW